MYSINSSKMVVIFLQSWTSAGSLSNSTGSFVTNYRFSPIIGLILEIPFVKVNPQVFIMDSFHVALVQVYWTGITCCWYHWVQYIHKEILFSQYYSWLYASKEFLASDSFHVVLIQVYWTGITFCRYHLGTLHPYEEFLFFLILFMITCI